MSYRLVFTFKLQPDREIDGLDAPVEFRHGPLGITFERFQDGYRLIVDNFPAEEVAANYVSSVWKALAWMLVSSELAFVAETKLQSVTYTDSEAAARRILGVKIDGRRLDTLLDGWRPAVVRSDKKFGLLTTLAPRIVVSTPVERVKETIIEGLSLSSGVVGDRLRIAVDLYGASYSESPPNARLITLVTALEALMRPLDKSQPALELLAKWQADVSQAKERVPKGSDDYADLESVERDLIFRRKRSIRSSFQKFVFDTLDKAGDPNAREQSQHAVAVYDQRSTLVHEGSLEPKELGDAVQRAREIAEAVLRAALHE